MTVVIELWRSDIDSEFDREFVLEGSSYGKIVEDVALEADIILEVK